MNLDKKIMTILDDVIDSTIRISDIDETTNLIEDCGVDSIKMMQLLLSIEDEFNIIIDDDYLVLDNLSDIKSLKKMINEITNKSV